MPTGHEDGKPAGAEHGSPDILLIWAIYRPIVFPSMAFGCYWFLTSNGNDSLNQQKLGRTLNSTSRFTVLVSCTCFIHPLLESENAMRKGHEVSKSRGAEHGKQYTLGVTG
jgi:hypothetical protein